MSTFVILLIISVTIHGETEGNKQIIDKSTDKINETNVDKLDVNVPERIIDARDYFKSLDEEEEKDYQEEGNTLLNKDYYGKHMYGEDGPEEYGPEDYGPLFEDEYKGMYGVDSNDGISLEIENSMNITTQSHDQYADREHNETSNSSIYTSATTGMNGTEENATNRNSTQNKHDHSGDNDIMMENEVENEMVGEDLLNYKYGDEEYMNVEDYGPDEYLPAAEEDEYTIYYPPYPPLRLKKLFRRLPVVEKFVPRKSSKNRFFSRRRSK